MNTEELNMKHSTPMIIEALRADGEPKLLLLAADRLEELQRQNDLTQHDHFLWKREQEAHTECRRDLALLITERDEARAEVERLKKEFDEAKSELHEVKYWRAYPPEQLEVQIHKVLEDFKIPDFFPYQNRKMTVLERVSWLAQKHTETPNDLQMQMKDFIQSMNENNIAKVKPEPSRLEIAAMFMQSIYARQYGTPCEFHALQRADALIAAEREAK
jgi:hypothetical protein